MLMAKGGLAIKAGLPNPRSLKFMNAQSSVQVAFILLLEYLKIDRTVSVGKILAAQRS